nr:MAG TPA: hypothetical protein [Caudoviricetes sp.]
MALYWTDFLRCGGVCRRRIPEGIRWGGHGFRWEPA